MTIDKAEMVKRIGWMRTACADDTIRRPVLRVLLDDVEKHITQQSQGRDEVLDEAAELADVQVNVFTNQYAHATRDHDKDRLAARANTAALIAGNIRALKSPSPAPVERRSEVDQYGCDHLDCRKSACGRTGRAGHWVHHCEAHEDWAVQTFTATPAAQPEPQGLVDGGFDVDLDKGTLHRTSYAYEYMDWCKSQPSGSHRNDFLWLLRELDRLAAITGGK